MGYWSCHFSVPEGWFPKRKVQMCSSPTVDQVGQVGHLFKRDAQPFHTSWPAMKQDKGWKQLLRRISSASSARKRASTLPFSTGSGHCPPLLALHYSAIYVIHFFTRKCVCNSICIHARGKHIQAFRGGIAEYFYALALGWWRQLAGAAASLGEYNAPGNTHNIHLSWRTG